MAVRDAACDPLEESLPDPVVHPGTVVGDREPRLSVELRERDLDGLSPPELHRIGEEIGDDLLQPELVPPAYDRSLGAEHERGALAGELVCELGRHLLDERTEIDVFEAEIELARPSPRHVEEGLDEALEAIRLPARERERCLGLGWVHPHQPPLQLVHAQLEARQRGAHLV